MVLSAIFMFAGCASTSTESVDAPKKKPTQHLKVDDVTTIKDAEAIFILKTSEIKRKTVLDVTELQEIHIITYTLEKSVAYLAENLKGENQSLAKELAVIVEDIHLNSEDNKKEETQKHISKYMELAKKLIANF